jgi:aminoglycoside 3-N-acetyltransferase
MNCIVELFAKKLKVKFKLGFLLNNKKSKDKISLDQVKSTLIELGIKQGDSIMVHSSLSHIAAKAPELISMLQELIGADGNILMPTHPKLSKDNNGELLYDPENSKSTVGYLTEYFRLMSDVKRSLHPFSSVAVWGKDKEWFLENNIIGNAPLPHGKNSPYSKFAEIGGKTVCIGVTAKNRGTIKHSPEEIMDDDFPLETFEAIKVIIQHNGTSEEKMFRRTILAFSEIYMCKSKIEKDWIKWGILQKRKIDVVPIEVLDAKKCVKLMIENINNGLTSYPYAPRKLTRVKE